MSRKFSQQARCILDKHSDIIDNEIKVFDSKDDSVLVIGIVPSKEVTYLTANPPKIVSISYYNWTCSMISNDKEQKIKEENRKKEEQRRQEERKQREEREKQANEMKKTQQQKAHKLRNEIITNLKTSNRFDALSGPDSKVSWDNLKETSSGPNDEVTWWSQKDVGIQCTNQSMEVGVQTNEVKEDYKEDSIFTTRVSGSQELRLLDELRLQVNNLRKWCEKYPDEKIIKIISNSHLTEDDKMMKCITEFPVDILDIQNMEDIIIFIQETDLGFLPDQVLSQISNQYGTDDLDQWQGQIDQDEIFKDHFDLEDHY